jgi:predicted NBD/HSP70 family sugar kinase
MNEKYFIGIDIGGTRIKAVICLEGIVLKQKIILTKSELSSDRIINRIIKLINDLIDFVGCKNSKLCGIGIGVPGIFEKNGKIINLPNLNVLNGVNFSDVLKSEFGSNIKFKIVNDAQLPFYFYNSTLKNQNILFLTLGTGLGVSFCLGGNIVTNKFGGCEFSHSKIFGTKTIEDFISTKFLLKNLNGSIKQNLGAIDFNVYGQRLGQSLSVLHNVFGFDKIILCGGISNYSNYFLDECIKSFEKNSYFPICEILVTGKGIETGAIGAVKLFDK